MSENKVTVYTLARELGVSVAAISRAFDPNSRLSHEKRELILKTAARYNYQPNRMASRLSMEELTIGVLNFSYIKSYYAEIQDGINAAYTALKDYKVRCDMRILQRGEASMEDAFAVLDEFYTRHYDGVIISGFYEDCVTKFIDRMADAGIRVATVQYNHEKSKRLFASMSNYPMIGEMAAQLCGILLRGSAGKKTVMFTGNEKSPTHQALVESFCSAAPREGFWITDIYDTKDRAECADEMVRKAFQTHPDIDAIYSSSANSIPICRYLEEQGLGDRVVFVASDVFAEMYRYLENRTIDATIYQEPFKMGYNAFELLYHAIAEGQPIAPTVYSTPRVVLSSNLHCYR